MAFVRRRAALAALAALALGATSCRTDGSATGTADGETRLAQQLGLPADYRATMTRYAEVYCSDLHRMRVLWANQAAINALRDGVALPRGTVLVAEMYAMSVAPDGEIMRGAFDHLAVSKRERVSQLGETIGDWELSGINLDGSRIPTGRCITCHEGAENSGYVFTRSDLSEYARRSAGGPLEPFRFPSILRTEECH